ncbi:hypothetical protein AAFC00_005651 [Neodothiora populina]|uniref:Carboxymethylenebutenolidase n=1 Tax=Neodothiora populina TaxID=2781224 RepID=A0ABR3PLV9_9PEZI
MSTTTALEPVSNITLQKPLSRLGRGPGLIIITDQASLSKGSINHTLDPLPRQKWAEEGYAVAELRISEDSEFQSDLVTAIRGLEQLAECSSDTGFGLISYLTSGSAAIASDIIDKAPEVIVVVSYGEGHLFVQSKPILQHLAGRSKTAPNGVANKVYTYPTAEAFFVLPSHAAFNSPAAAVSHTRTLAFIKPILGGPYFDLEAIWEEHTLYEFEERDVAKTMATMVQEPYVNHVPTITGGIGRLKLTGFYRDHFIFNNPDDTALELVSRTVGIDRVIDEFIFSFTHDKIIDWLLPGVPPTGKHVKVPFTGVVNIRGDHLYHEHIWWDQATVLVQLGLLPEYLPFPYPINGKMPEPGNRFEYRVPAAGVETATKLADENAVESNAFFDFAPREVEDK